MFDESASAMLDRFCRFDLRTTDADAARRFYAPVLGHDRSRIWPLHEQARARGAPAHWLGQIGVADVERARAAFLELGAEPLGPVVPTPDGGRSAVVRDPGGAVLGVATPPAAPLAGVAWHVLNTAGAPRALDPVSPPGGPRLGVCEDPQGAAFGLIEGR